MGDSKNKGRKISLYWNHFTELEVEDMSRRRVRCEHCYKVLGLGACGTGNMGRHLKKMHPAVMMMIGEAEGLDVSETQINSETEIEAADGEDSETSTVETYLKKDSPNDVEQKGNKRRSVYWNHFTAILDDDGVERRARCKHCERAIVFQYGCTGNLARHIKTLHPAIYMMIKKAEGFDMSETQINSETEIDYEALDEDETYSETVETDQKRDSPNDVKLKGNKRRSVYWNHFTAIEDDDGVQRRARCKHCDRVIFFANGCSGNLTRHIKTLHPVVQMMIKQGEGQDMSETQPHTETETETVVEYVTEDGRKFKEFYIVQSDEELAKPKPKRSKRNSTQKHSQKDNTHLRIEDTNILLDSLPLLTKQEDDRIDVFTKLVGMKMRALDTRQRILVEKVINDALHEAEMNSWQSTVVHKVEDLTNPLEELE
ncbi:hypothetical protein JYU34_021989 [Plutella xylostella]|uniref:BED-type domain-containing protein n=1 Tax=Plutella xylostella TaxID=51655 RepID=A0ABQ7PS37_PLUXY|nr:hypothetical protein JYU34_021989 [Plutella xylostella]